MENKKKKWLQSSQKPEEISESIKGGVIALSSILIFFGMKLFGIEINQADIMQLGTYFGMIGGAVWGLKGLIMKIIVKVGTDK